MTIRRWGSVSVVGQATGTQTDPYVVQLADGDYAIAWEKNVGGVKDLYLQRFNADGTLDGAAILVSSGLGLTSDPTIVAASDGGFYVSGTRTFSTTDQDVFIRRFDASGIATTTSYMSTSGDGEGHADLVRGSASMIAVYQNDTVNSGDILLRVVNQTTLNPGTAVAVNTTLAGAQVDPDAAALRDSSDFVVAWHDKGAGVVRARIFDYTGTAKTAEITVSTGNLWGDADASIVAMAGGGFMVTWNSFINAPSISGQLFSSTGAAIGSNFLIDAQGQSYKPEAAAMANGEFVVVWHNAIQGRLVGQYFNAFGDKVGSTFTVATDLSSNPNDSNEFFTVAGLADGRFVVTWQAFTDVSGESVIRSQIFDPRDGVVEGTASRDTLYGNDILDDQIIGFSGDDVLYGMKGDDWLSGDAGADSLNGGLGVDTMIGGTGNDDYYVDNAGDEVVEEVGGGVDSVFSTLSWVLGDSVENLILQGNAALSGTGNALNNALFGNGGANTLTGLAGADELDGKGGADTMIGGLGADTYYVDNAGDKVIETVGDGAIDTVYTSVTLNLGVADMAGVENVLVQGLAAVNLAGNALANTLVGNSANNSLDGKGGADAMYGGLGNDTYYVNSTGDVVSEAGGGGTDTVRSTISYTLGTDIENGLLLGSSAINLIGNELSNTLTGNGAANILAGKGGADYLAGGGGADTFDYNSISESTYAAYDRLTDFESIDKIDLSGIDANTNLAGNQAFVKVAALSGAAGQMALSYNSGSNYTVLVADVNGDGVADMRIVMLGGDFTGHTNFVF